MIRTPQKDRFRMQKNFQMLSLLSLDHQTLEAQLTRGRANLCFHSFHVHNLESVHVHFRLNGTRHFHDWNIRSQPMQLSASRAGTFLHLAKMWRSRIHYPASEIGRKPKLKKVVSSSMTTQRTTNLLWLCGRNISR